MEQGGIARWLLVGVAALILVVFLPKWWSGSSHEPQPLLLEPDRAAPGTEQERLCDIWTPEFRAQLSTRGASVKHFELLTAKYRKKGVGIDLSTTPDVPLRQQLYFHWRNPASAPGDQRGTSALLDAKYWQVKYDLLPWELVKADGKSCTFRYRSPEAELTQVVRATGRPYELEAHATIKNLAKEPRLHALSVHTTAWRRSEEVAGSMFRVSPFITNVECVLANGSATRLAPTEFEPKKFRKKTQFFVSNERNLGDWYEVAGEPSFAAVSNAYFAHAVVPIASPAPPVCQLQIEKRGAEADPRAGAMYRARVAYPPVELKPGDARDYTVLAYAGPKERVVLAAAAEGRHNLSELINLGFFSVIAKVLVAFLLKVHSVIPSWGLAIIVLTVTARTLLFPLQIPGIRSMIKMRELKPELDAIKEKFKDDPQQQGVAQMELWRQKKVNPFIGCLPQLATLPVWFALYTTLQTAAELYNIPFLWFPDLSEPDPYFILPFVIGATSFVQQKMMPMNMGDPAQQQMMLYFMPAMFTVFMLFLPAGLGIYMFTNSLLGIMQQQAVEWHARRVVKPTSGAPGGGEDGTRKSRVRGKRRGKAGDDDAVALQGKDADEPGAA